MSTRVIQKIIQLIHLVLHRGLGSFTSNPYIFKINNIVPRCSGTFIKKNRNIRVLGITASLTLSILTIATIFPITKQSDTAEATYVPATTTLSIVSSKDTASVDITPTSASGTFATSAAADMAEFTVTTDNLTGYSLNILGTDTSGQLVNSTTGDTLDTITSDTTENDFRTGNASTYNNKWGYRLTVNSTTTTNFFSAPTSTTTAKTIYTTSAPNTTGTSDSFTLGVGARVDYTKPVGTYTNTFVLTAVANNITYAINYLDNTGDTITDLPAAEGSSNITASSFTLSTTEPQRTGYDFIGWCDGTVTHVASGTDTCAGTTYQAGDNYTFTNISSTSTNTANLYAMWKDDKLYMQDITSTTCTTTPTTVYDNRDEQSYIIQKLADGNCWMMTNLNLGATALTTDLTSANTNLSTTVAASAFNGWKKSTGSANYTAAEYIPVSGTDSTSQTPYGTLYNYCATSAGTICTSSNSSDASYDICPKGWRLPTGGSSGEFQTLYNQSAYNTNAKMRAPIASGGAAFALAGTSYNAAPVSQGSRGDYWSSTRNDNTLMYSLSLDNTSNVNPAYYDGRNGGISIRCILDDPRTISDITTMQEMSPQIAAKMNNGDTATLKDSRDGKSYTIAKLADGQIWMTSNLNLAGGTALYSDDSDVDPANTRASGVAYYTLPNSSSSGFSSNTVAYVYNTGNETTSQTSVANNSYYSWLAATAGGKDTSDTAVTGNGPDAAYSICPKGWRLPKSGNQSDTSNPTTTGYKKGDFYKLATAYGANLESSYYQNSAVFYQNAGPGTLPNFLLAGYYYSSSFYSGGTSGFYWSSSSYSSADAYRLNFNSSYVNSAYGNYRRYGFSVRCVFAGA